MGWLKKLIREDVGLLYTAIGGRLLHFRRNLLAGDCFLIKCWRIWADKLLHRFGFYLRNLGDIGAEYNCDNISGKGRRGYIK